MLFYRLPSFKDVNEFLALLAKRFGKLKKGGILDVENAARKVLNDWNSGKLKYYTVPPEVQSLPSHISAEIVTEMSKEFDINDLIYDQEMIEIDKNIPKKVNESGALVIDSFGFTPAQLNENNGEEVEEMDADNGQQTLNIVKTNIFLKENKNKEIKDSEMKEVDSLEGMQLNKAKKAQFKKLKKQRKRNTKLANKLSLSLESNVSLNNESYDFETDFQ
jgi:nuclear GTP-binding protein